MYRKVDANGPLLLEGGEVLTMRSQQELLPGHNVLIKDGLIARLAPQAEVWEHPGAKRLDCQGRIIIPGLINCHSHLFEVVQRSLRGSVPLEVWLLYRLGYERRLAFSPQEVYAAQLLACMEMIRNGVTAVLDHFSCGPRTSLPHIEAAVAALGDSGMRAAIVPLIRDRSALEGAELKGSGQPLPISGQDADELMEICCQVDERASSLAPRLTFMVGPSSPHRCSDRLLQTVARWAEKRDIGIHTHVLETKTEAYVAERLYGKSVVSHLEALGILSPRLSIAHAVWLTDNDIELLARRGVSVVHNPASNLKLASGLAPVRKMLDAGINVALGTDGGDCSDSYSIFDQMKLAALVHNLCPRGENRGISSWEALSMATTYGAAIFARDDNLGRIKEGARADLVILKPSLRLLPRNDTINQLVFCENGTSVETVIINGRIVMEEGRLLTIDEEWVLPRIEQIAERVRQVRPEVEQEVRELQPYLTELYKERDQRGGQRG